MSLYLRQKALESLKDKKPKARDGFDKTMKVTDVFESDVFGDKQLQDKLPPSAYKAFRKSYEKGEPLSASVADQIAAAMKEWAISKGATHFTHWFQPLHGLTAEKHDSFINFIGSTYNRSLNMNFSGKQLIQGEPDASSFPSGGIRSTFEARGYTAWDMSSPSFIRQGTNGSFLMIPTAFCSWTGEALDYKTPLLRSNEAVSKATIRVLNLVRDKNQAISASSSLGVEQEFFAIDRGFYMARPDLMTCGRTLLGAKPSRGQELEDHYFGTMDRRIFSFIQDVEWTCWSLGIPATTRHNEVAPSQYEMAPIYEPVSVAADHNLLLMEVLHQKAKEHDLAVLFHEKPFDYVNGSGKHNNWSIATNLGENMMEPGNTPLDNVQFLVFLAATIRGVSLHGDMLRASIAVVGNDHRLGANEAPPAIISAYVGDLLEKVIADLTDETGAKSVKKIPSTMKLGVTALPTMPRDQSDRNRTSPFAFTGNKFEFRAVGSSSSCARPATALNTMLADSLHYVADEIEKKLKEGIKKEVAIHSVVVDTLKEHKRAVFNGNGYSEDWIVEAEKRGLWNLRTYPEAVEQLASEKNVKLFESMNVLSKIELASHQHILYEQYIKCMNIEANCTYNLTFTSVLPVCIDYRKKLADSIDKESPLQVEHLKDYSVALDSLMAALKKLKSEIARSEKFTEEQLHDHATFFTKEISAAMKEVRKWADTLEEMVDDALWPLPKYSEMLFLK